MYLALTDLFRVRWTERIHEEWISGVLKDQGHRLFQGRVGPARFERRPTIRKRRELLVGRRGEAPLVPPYILPSFIKALALLKDRPDLTRDKLTRVRDLMNFHVSDALVTGFDKLIPSLTLPDPNDPCHRN